MDNLDIPTTTKDDIDSDTSVQCMKCFLPLSSDCELCYWNTIVQESSERLFKELEFDDEYDS